MHLRRSSSSSCCSDRKWSVLVRVDLMLLISDQIFVISLENFSPKLLISTSLGLGQVERVREIRFRYRLLSGP